MKSHTPMLAQVCLAALLLLAAQQADAFEQDKVYKYDFEGAITSKVADVDKPQYSGTSISSNLLVKRAANNELVIKLDKPQVATFNELIEQIHLHKFDYKPFDSNSDAFLSKAFKVYFEDGSVKALDVYRDEPKWVTNLKRGLLSFLQLKLDSAPSSNDANSGFFTTNERSVFGECDTDYLVMDSGPVSPDDQSVRVFNVTKTRNMAKCKTRFMHRFMPIDADECFDSDKELQQYKHSNAIFNFNLVGSRQNYVIEQALLDEVSVFSPFGQRAHTHSVQSKFMLRLSSQQDAQQQVKPESGAARVESLLYEPPETLNFYANVNLDDAHHLASILQSSASVDQVMGAFDKLVQEHKTFSSLFEGQGGEQLQKTAIGQYFMRLSELVGTMNAQKIDQLYSQIDEKGEAHKKIFWDLMSVVGTNPSFMFMKKLITEGEAPSVKTRAYLTRLSFHIKMPSKALFDAYIDLCKSDKIQAQQQYKRLCSLPLASLIHQHCVKPHSKYMRMVQEGNNATAFKKAQNTCQIATAEEYFSRLVQPMAAGSTPTSTGGSSSSSAVNDEMTIGDKMFNIKMAGELGVKASMEYLSEIVRNKNEHPSLRAAAMWNLNKVARIYPGLVKKFSVPFYYDSNELLEVRIAAFSNWLMGQGISLHELETLGKQLMYEPSRQLVLYMHSLVKSLSELTSFPCSYSKQKIASMVLPVIERALKNHAAGSFSDSRASISSSYLPEFGYGTFTMQSLIFSNESFAPSNFYYASREIMSGLVLQPMTVSVQAHGLDKLIKRVAGINGLLADKESFMDVFSLRRRSKRDTAAEQQLIKQETNEIDKELKLGSREFSDVYLAVTVSAYGRPVTFMDKDSRELKKMLSEDGTIKVPQIKKLLHSFNNHTTQQMMIAFEKFELFNNEMGLPLFQSINDFDYKTFKLNSVKIDVEPGFFKDERQGKPPTKISAALDAKFGRHNEMLITSGSLLPHLQQQLGVGFHKKKQLMVPLKMSVEVNLLDSKVLVKRSPIHENILHISQQPLTFTRNLEPSDSSLFASLKPLYNSDDLEEMKPFTLDYMTPLAVGLRATGKHLAGQDWSLAAWRRYLSSVGLGGAKFLYFYSPTGSPFEMSLSTVTTERNPTREMSSHISWKHNHGGDVSLNELEKELEQFTNVRDALDRPATVSYQLALHGGSTSERKVALDINYSRSFDRLLHKWRVFYQRTALDQSSADQASLTNLCWLGTAQFGAQSIEKWLKFDLLGVQQSANLTSELTFGEQCSASSSQADSGAARVSMKATFDQSEEQKALIEAALRSENKLKRRDAESSKKNEYLRLFKQCQKKRQSGGAMLDASCVHLMYKMSELLHVSATFDYRDVPDRWTSMAKRAGALYTYARAGYIDSMDDHGVTSAERNYASSGDSKLQRSFLEANLTGDSHHRKLNFEVDAQNYRVAYKALPFSLPPPSTFPLFDASYYQLVQKRFGSRFCTVSSSSVTTFDNYTYALPSAVGDGCFKLLAKDCSPESNYVVLGAKVGQAKVIKVYVGQKYKIEFVPEKGGQAAKIGDIKVNGQSVTVEANKAPLKRDTKLGPRQVEAFSIENNGAYYTLSSKLYKFAINTDGAWILIQQSKYYAGKSCGICGDANGDSLMELKAPSSNNKVCKNTTDFVWSYVLPSTCASRPAQIECA